MSKSPLRRTGKFKIPPKHKSAYLANRTLMIARAREAVPNAYQYREFRVAAAVLAYRPEYDSPTSPFYRLAYNIFIGVNEMPIKGGPKVCAEQGALNAARAHGYFHIVAVCVIGEAQNDDVSHAETLTLHPCWTCRTLMAALPEISADTIILTARTNQDLGEEQTFSQLLRRHNNGDGHDVHQAHDQS